MVSKNSSSKIEEVDPINFSKKEVAQGAPYQ